MRHTPATWIALALLLAAPTPLRAQEPGHDLGVAAIGSDSAKYAFLHALQRAVNSDDRRGVAQMVRYPLRVNNDGRSTPVVDTVDFVRRYQEIVTPSVRRAIAAQVAESLYATGQGVMIGSGDVWLGCSTPSLPGMRCGRIAVMAINLDASSSP